MKKMLVVALIVLVGVFMLSVSSVMAQGEPCTADFTCDGDVDADDVTEFLNQFGRGQYFDPCPDCYDSPCPCSPLDPWLCYSCSSGQMCEDVGCIGDCCCLKCEITCYFLCMPTEICQAIGGQCQ